MSNKGSIINIDIKESLLVEKERRREQSDWRYQKWLKQANDKRRQRQAYSELWYANKKAEKATRRKDSEERYRLWKDNKRG